MNTTEAVGQDEPSRFARHSGKRPSRLNVLLLASLFKMPYRVLRCVEDAGASAFVLGTSSASGLRHSRYCKKFILTECKINGGFDPDLASEISRVAEQWNIDLVIACDAPTTRALIAVRDLLTVSSFPMPNLIEFDILNNKWKFVALCNSLNIPCPPTQLIYDSDHLIEKIESGAIPLPAIAKPLSLDSGRGCIILKSNTYRKRAAGILVRPILCQSYVEGEDVCASVYCREGQIVTFTAYKYRRGTYSGFFSEAIYNAVSRLMRSLNFSGICNFDMRMAPDGEILFLECNPRCFFNIAMSMLAGINFIVPGLPLFHRHVPARPPQPVRIRSLKAILATIYAPWRLTKLDGALVKYVLSDLVPHVREELGLEKQVPAAWDAFETSRILAEGQYQF